MALLNKSLKYMLGRLVLLAVLGGLAAFIFKLALVLDINKRVYNHSPGPCHQVTGIKHGSEDIAMIEDEGIAFITSGLFYMSERVQDVKGKIFIYDVNIAAETNVYEAVPLKIEGSLNQDKFAPHGITHWIQNGAIRLFVLSHSKPEFHHTVEVFDYDKNRNVLKHVKTIKDDKFVRPNDLTATGWESFIISNDGWAQTTLTNLIEVFSGLEMGSVAYYDGKVSHWLLEKAMSPNGILLSRDKKTLFVSHINSESIGVYSVAKDVKSLNKIVDVPMLTSSDNFYQDSDGALWTGAHPVFKDGAGHLGDSDNMDKWGPSQILRIKFAPDFKSWEVVEVFADDGRRLSASSIAVHFKNNLLFGTVFRQMLHCQYSHPSIITHQ